MDQLRFKLKVLGSAEAPGDLPLAGKYGAGGGVELVARVAVPGRCHLGGGSRLGPV